MDNKKIGERLRALRGKKTQAEVANALGITQAAYCLYETGQRIPRDPLKKRIADYYHRSVNTIFFAD